MDHLNDRSLIDRSWIQRRLQEGRGQGEGPHWRPWLEVRDVPSRGWSYRLRSWHHDGCHHLLSTIERDYCLVLSWSPAVVDIATQVPLIDVDRAVAIADELGIRYPVVPHPTRPKQRMLPILTSDVRVHVRQQGLTTTYMRTVKRADDLLSRRVREKLRIEQVYWQQQGIDWGIVTDASIPRTLARNVWLVYNYQRQDEVLARCAITHDQLWAIDEVLLPRVRGGAILNVSALACDHQLGLPAGTSLAVAYHLVAARCWTVDMYQPLDPGQPLLFSTSGSTHAAQTF